MRQPHQIAQTRKIPLVVHCVLVVCESKLLTTEEKETHPDHEEKDRDGAKDDVYKCGTGDLLREIQTLDGRVQGGKNTVSLVRLMGLGLVCRGWNAR